ncbi:glycosyltransferase, partial [Thioclava sp. BHET1]
PEIDLGQCPTDWQMGTFPDAFRERSYICHDGIRTDLLRPDTGASLKLGRLKQPLTRHDEVFTYMARNMEPVRGFHIFMRALPHILAARPKARVLIIGGNGTSYGKESDKEGGYRAEMEREIGAELDWNRVHFLGRVAYGDFQRVIQLSRCHIYLTVPFVLSWSLLEAMSMGAVIVASDTAPVREVVRDGETGILTDFFAPKELARKVVEVLSDPESHAQLGRAARADIVARYDFNRCAAPVHIARMNSLLPHRLQIEMPVVQA